MMNNELITKKINLLYEEIVNKETLPNEFAVLFVYNEPDSIEDEEHSSECILPIERDMIANSFRKSVQCVYLISSEEDFILTIRDIQKKHKYILIYSMAQNVHGIGRRSLIPLLCEYYKLINISSCFFSSTLSSNKKLMYTLLEQCKELHIPHTIYINKTTDLRKSISSLNEGYYIIKPNDESASIGVKKLFVDKQLLEEVIKEVENYHNIYESFYIQEYIEGAEVEVPLLCYQENYYCPGCVEIVNDNPQGYLDYDTVKMDAYDFAEFSEPIATTIIASSKQVARILEFNNICRVDFRIKDNIPYIIDIGANPTISYHSSTNYIFRKKFGNESAVYQLLLYISLYNNTLFEPSFDKSK